MKFNFQAYRAGYATTYGEPYDKESLVHYPNNAFAIDPRIPVITDRQNSRRRLGQRRGFSAIDIRQINKHYNCKQTTRGANPTRPTTNKQPKTRKPKTVVQPKTVVKPTPACKDEHRYCKHWRKFCKMNSFVRAKCRKLCNL